MVKFGDPRQRADVFGVYFELFGMLQHALGMLLAFMQEQFRGSS